MIYRQSNKLHTDQEVVEDHVLLCKQKIAHFPNFDDPIYTSMRVLG